MSMFSQALSSGLATVRAVAGDVVTYRRGAKSVPVAAVPGHTDYEMTDDYGVTITMTARDWLIAVADLILDGVPIKPQKGDRIDARGESYEALPVKGEACYGYSDPDLTQFRVHTKQIT